MTKRIIALALLAAVALPLQADFAAIARAIESHRGVRRVWIPFFGVARFLVRVIQPKGVHDVQLATFEGAERVDPRELNALLKSKLEQGFRPLVQVRSRKEWSFIYARPRGNRIELVILAHDDEMVLLRVDVDADVIARELGDPRHAHHVASR
ncbi:MAG TPA: hypothetical protein VNA69_14750 [Thermoanaerobaculia bacterium]|nr:hypothetical protein [Thermoanaerobaculia bacterium]